VLRGAVWVVGPVQLAAEFLGGVVQFFRFGLFERAGEGLFKLPFGFPPFDCFLGEGLAGVPSPEHFFLAVLMASLSVVFLSALERSASFLSTIWFWAVTGG
jgi:hypothetical protein